MTRKIDCFFTARYYIVQQIKTFLASNLNAPQHLDGESVLNAIAVQQGILVERAEDVFSFSHLTLQEYLTAQYIDDHRQVEKLVTEHLTDERWKEVFLLVAGLMRGGADDWLVLMEKEAQKYINTPKLQALLNWVEQVTAGSIGGFKPVGKRAVAIESAYAIAHTYANANAIANANAYAGPIANANANANANADADPNAYANAIAKNIAYVYGIVYVYAIDNVSVMTNANAIAKVINYFRELEKLKIFNNINFTVLIARLEALRAKVPDDQQPPEVLRAFANRLQETLLNAFNITQEMVNLSKEEAKTLGDYLYANHLIIQCKQAAVRVSPKTWEAIEARMLLVPGG